MAKLQVLVKARKSPQQARSRALVETILDTTARILVADGFAGVTTNGVAELAGVSIGSLYQYFPSREALVAAVARRHSERLKSALETELKQDHADLEAALTALLAAVARAHRVSPKLTAVLAGEVPKLGSLDWKAENTRRGIELARALLARHRGELRQDLDLDTAAFVCAACVEGVMNAAARHSPQRIGDGSIAAELRKLIGQYVRRRK